MHTAKKIVKLMRSDVDDKSALSIIRRETRNENIIRTYVTRQVIRIHKCR